MASFIERKKMGNDRCRESGSETEKEKEKEEESTTTWYRIVARRSADTPHR